MQALLPRQQCSCRDLALPARRSVRSRTLAVACTSSNRSPLLDEPQQQQRKDATLPVSSSSSSASGAEMGSTTDGSAQRSLGERLRRAVVVASTYLIGTVDTCVTIAENASRNLGFPHFITPKVCTAPLVGKVCVVTGANAGIGLATAEILAARGAHVILACRSKERGEAAATLLRQRCSLLPGCGQAPQVEVMQVDMASLKSVRQFCAAFNARKLPLHLLVANAGLMSPPTRLVTEDGLEMQFQVNFLGHWLMAHELMAEQRRRRANGVTYKTNSSSSTASTSRTPGASSGKDEAAEAQAGRVPGWGLPEDGTRLVLLSSLMHHAGMLDWKDMQSAKFYDPFTSYALSKLTNAITAVELHRRLTAIAKQPGASKWGVRDSVVAVHPGVVNTDLATNFFKTQGLVAAWPASKPVVEMVVDTLAPYAFKTTQASAAGVAAACLAPAEQVSGAYLINGKPGRAAREVYDPAVARELWDVAQRLTGLEVHESMKS